MRKHRQLQWSRFFSKRKIYLLDAAQALPVGGFNGAAFFQSGKSVEASLRSLRQTAASMEPLFFKAENGIRQ